ncbi:autotransporter outer membrane beta-barrel domain-containing protein, partial [Paraburkholderia aspalathi]|nr:autotransporter outer membrane beta-barrel domain-containing protein [Paraburkholderia aspalathi]
MTALAFAASAARAQATIDNVSGSGCAACASGLVTVNGNQSGNQTSPWNVGGGLTVGDTHTGELDIGAGGSVTTSGAPFTLDSIGNQPGSRGAVNVSGPGATWISNTQYFYVGLNGNGTLTIGDGGTVEGGGIGIIIAGGGATAGNVTVMGAGSLLTGPHLQVGLAGNGTLTIADQGQVTTPLLTIATLGTGTGTLNIGAAAGQPAAAPGTLNTPTVAFGAGTGDIVFNHTDTSGNYTFAPPIGGTGAVDVYSGETVMTGASTYAGPTTIHGGTLSAGAPNVFSPNSDYAVHAAGALNLRGNSQTLASLTNAGLVSMGSGTTPGTVLTT